LRAKEDREQLFHEILHVLLISSVN
jgi:hypothetical protein